jgi:prepilin-type N-terminal cleavage/methylation domain-containing protein
VNRGFTLLEVIISLVIFVMGVIAVVYLFPMGLKASKKAELTSLVSILAQKILEDTKSARFQAIDPLSPQIPLEGTEGNLRWRISLRDVTAPGTEEKGLREVTLTIFWTEEGKERSRSFLIYVAD